LKRKDILVILLCKFSSLFKQLSGHLIIFREREREEEEREREREVMVSRKHKRAAMYKKLQLLRSITNSRGVIL
jgi:hypothetical protein